MEYNTKGKVLKKAVVWKDLYFYRKSDTLFQLTVEFCHSHNDYSDYEPFVNKMSDEEMANMALTLCHQTDKMMCSYIEKLEKQFVTEGGIKERMYAARTGYRQEQDARMKALEAENAALKQRIAELEQKLREPR